MGSANTEENYRFHFNDGNLVMHVNGGGGGSHDTKSGYVDKIPEFIGDHVYVRKVSLCGLKRRTVIYSVERKQVSTNNAVFLLTPIKIYKGCKSRIADLLESCNKFRFFDPRDRTSDGTFNVAQIQLTGFEKNYLTSAAQATYKKKGHGENGIKCDTVLISIAREGEELCATVPLTMYQGLLNYAKVSASSNGITIVTTRNATQAYCSPAEADLLTAYLRAQPGVTKSVLYIVPTPGEYPKPSPVYDTLYDHVNDVKPIVKMIDFMPPLLREHDYVASQSDDMHHTGIKRRLIEPRETGDDIRSKASAMLREVGIQPWRVAQAAKEFHELELRRVREYYGLKADEYFEPLDEDTTIKQAKTPAQARKYREGFSYGPGDGLETDRSMLKAEAQSFGHPRIIVPTNATYAAKYAQYVVAMKTYQGAALGDRRHGSVVGCQPAEIAERLAALASRPALAEPAHDPIEGEGMYNIDYEKMDGRVDAFQTQDAIEKQIAYFGPKHEATIRKCAANTTNTCIIAATALVNTGTAQRSGRGDTSESQTDRGIKDEFAYWRCVPAGVSISGRPIYLTPEQAWEKIGLNMGDDKATRLRKIKAFEAICAYFGHSVKHEYVPTDAELNGAPRRTYVTFINRIYSPLIFKGSVASIACPRRAMRKIHMTHVNNANVPAATKLVEKCLSIFLNDSMTPFWGKFSRLLLEAKGIRTRADAHEQIITDANNMQSFNAKQINHYLNAYPQLNEPEGWMQDAFDHDFDHLFNWHTANEWLGKLERSKGSIRIATALSPPIGGLSSTEDKEVDQKGYVLIDGDYCNGQHEGQPKPCSLPTKQETKADKKMVAIKLADAKHVTTNATKLLATNRKGAIVVSVSGTGKSHYAAHNPFFEGVSVIDTDTIVEYPSVANWWTIPELRDDVNQRHAKEIATLAAHNNAIYLVPDDYGGILQPDVIVDCDQLIHYRYLKSRQDERPGAGQPGVGDLTTLQEITKEIINRWPNTTVCRHLAEGALYGYAAVKNASDEPPSAPPATPPPQPMEEDSESGCSTPVYRPKSPTFCTDIDVSELEDALSQVDEGLDTPYYAKRVKSNAGSAAYDEAGVHYAAYQHVAAMNRQFKRRTGQLWVAYDTGDKTYRPEGCYDFTRDDCAFGRSCRYRHDIPGQCRSVNEGKPCRRPNCEYNHSQVDPLKIEGYFDDR